MEIKTVLELFAALSQETRLLAFRELVKAGSEGLAAGALSKALDVPHNTLSFHLNHLTNAGAVTVERRGRSMIYAANFPAIHGLLSFLVEDCCSVEFAAIEPQEDTTRTLISLNNGC